MKNLTCFSRSVLRAFICITLLPFATSQAAPVLTGISPSSGPTQGGTALTLTGSGFGVTASAMVNGNALQVTSVTNTRIIGTAPAGEGAGNPVTVIAGGEVSNSITFDYLPPSINTISPALVSTSGGTTITLSGSNFGISSSVSLNGSAVIPLTRSHTQITFTMPAGQGASLPVIVTAAGQSSPASTISYLPPSISSISPASASTGGGTSITITGSNFGTARSVTIGGKPAPVTSGSHTQLVITLPTGDGANQPVVVTAGSQNSNPAFFSYSPPAITDISPSSGRTAGNILITLTGSNFGLSPQIDFDGSTLQPNSASHTQVVFSLPAGQGTNLPIAVSANGQVSSAVSFSYLAPTISSISPATGPTAGNIPITIRGENFGLTPAVTIGGISAPLSSAGNSHTQLVVTLPAGQGLDRDVVVSVGTRQSNAIQFDYAAPQLASISYSSAPTAGGSVITLTGSNFGTSGVVTVDGVTAPPTAVGSNDSSYVCTLPPGQGQDLPVILKVSGQDSNPLLLSYDPPLITSVSATGATTAGGTLITINGLNFGTSRTATIGASSVELTPASNHTRLIGTVPPGQGAGLPLTVNVDGRISNSVLFSYARPEITSVTSTSAPTAGGSTITLSGNGFGTSPVVTLDGAAVPTISASHGVITFSLPSGQGANLPIVVAASNQNSDPVYFSYDLPVITGISPATGPTAGGNKLTITGNNFGVSQSVLIGGQGAGLDPQATHTKLVVTVPAGGGVDQPVVVGVGGRSSNSVLYSYLPPAITSISPGTGPIAGGTPITINGDNFSTAPSVSISGNAVSQVIEKNHGRIVCILPPGTGQNKQVVVTAFGQISNSVLFSYETRVFADWAASFVWNGLDSSLNADPRQTGWKNSLSYGFGVNPTTTTGGETASLFPPVRGRPAISRNVAGLLQLSFWRRRAEVYPDLSYQVEFSSGLDLSSWEAASLPPQIQFADAEWEYCTYTDHSGGAGRFGRVQIGVRP